MNNLNMYKLSVIFIYEKNHNIIYLRDIEYQTADALQNGKKWSNPNNFEQLERIPDTLTQ